MKKFLFFLFLIVGGYVFGQTNTTLVNYKFDQSDLTPDAGAIGSPSISLVNTTDFSTTYAAGNPNTGKALTTQSIKKNSYGGYIKLTINTTGYTNVSISFDGYGVGSPNTFWDVFANKNGALPTFDTATPTTDFVGTVQNNKDAWSIVSPTRLLTTDNSNFDNSPSVTIYIAAYNNGQQDRSLIIDNLKITGCKIPAAPTATAQTFCSGRTVADLVATGDSGNTFSWYTVASGGTALASTTALSTGTYYVSQSNNCGNSSPRTAVAVTVNPLPAAPTVSGGGTFCGSATISATGGSGETVYYQGTTSNGTSTTSGGSPQTVSASGTYYFRSQNANGCWGPQSSVTVTIATLPSAVASAPVPANNASGVCYQGPGAVSSVSWTAVAGAASYDVYFGAGTLPGTLTANVTTNSYNTGVLSPNTTYHWKVVPRNICGITTGTPVEWTFTTGSKPCVCVPSIGSAYLATTYYIKTVNFIGNIANSTNTSTSSASPTNGYQDFTGLGSRAIQAQGEGVNIFVDNQLGSTAVYMKVWVDWGKDGNFDDSDLVYQCTNAFVNTTFGFQIPPGQTPGDYRIRFRTNRSNDNVNNNSFVACGNIDNYGETEDYLFTVIENCAFKINTVTPGFNCGSGSVTLGATGTSGTTQYKWYDAQTGGSLLATTTSTTWPTPPISATTTYYVTASNGSGPGTCESLFRTPVVATIKKVPALTFGSVTPEICGGNSIALSASSANEQIYLIDENFEDTANNAFKNNQIKSPNGTITNWQVRTSTYVPKYPDYPVWYPAISSGFGSNKFVMSTSDLTTGGTTAGKVEEALELKTAVNTTGFVNLTLSFKMYFSSYNDSNNANIEGVFVEVDTGSGWSATPLKSFLTDVGIGTNFITQTIDMKDYINVNSLKIRIRYRAGWCDGVAIDDIKLFGDKPLTPSFTWTSSHPIEFYSDVAATVPYVPNTPASIIYIKPNDSEMESYTQWDITATATLSNSCSAQGTVSIVNNSKIYKATDTNTVADWTTTTNWKPDGQLPDLTKCVIVKTPVVIPTNVIGLGKEVTVQTGGTLNIQKDASLKVQNQFVNSTGNPKAVLIESDGGLVQVNEGNTINTGNITAQRTVKLTVPRQQYNYIISPLEGQNLKSIYPGITYVLYHNETNNYFYNSSGAYIKGRGLAVKEPTNAGVVAGTTAVNANFEGYPTNGAFTYSLVNTAPLATPPSSPSTAIRGYNLVGNPYPSNIDLNILYDINGGNSGTLSQTFYFWDSTVNDRYVQEGSKYDGKSYGIFNAASPPGTGSGVAATGDINSVSLKKPTNIVKMGQGFMVRSTASTMQMKFNNTIRTTGTVGESYFGKNIPEKTVDRYWLKLVSPTGIAASCVVVYFPGGDNGFARDDSFTMGGSDVIYSQVENQKLAINGRSSFTKTDVVPLGTSQFGNGYYKIGIETAEGIFQNDQPVYLKDLQTGIVTNLSEGDYVFAANAGESTGRFEIIYEPETVLATGSNTKEGLVVYRDGGDFVVKSSSEKITHLAVYDAGGRLVFQDHPNANNAKIENSGLVNGVYILKITLENGEVVPRKIVK